MATSYPTRAGRKDRPWLTATRQVLFAMLIGIGLAAVLPYVIGEELIVRGVARIYAPLVGAHRGTEGRDAVSVILIDDKSLQNAQQTWPASYGYYARLLDSLAQYRPRAIFIDVVFASRRDDASLARLIEATCKAREAGIRVYFAVRRSETGSFPLRSELQDVVPRCIEPVAIEYDPDALDQIAWNYRVQPEPTQDGASLHSVAATIYRDQGGALPAQGHAALAINWGYLPANSGIEWLVADKKEHDIHASASAHDGDSRHAGDSVKAVADESAFSTYCRQPGNPFYEILPPALRSHWNPDVFKPVCVFHETLYPADLSTSAEEEEDRLTTQLRDRVVMIGTALQGSNDRVTSPLHGSVPGVYLHAAALDNLLHYGEHYKRTVHLGGQGDGLRVLALMIFGFIVMVAMNAGGSWMKKRFLPEPAATVPAWKRRSVVAGNGFARKSIGFVAYSAFFTLMIFVGQQLDLGMLTVAHVSLFASMAEWLEWGEKLEPWWTGELGNGNTHHT